MESTYSGLMLERVREVMSEFMMVKELELGRQMSLRMRVLASLIWVLKFLLIREFSMVTLLRVDLNLN